MANRSGKHSRSTAFSHAKDFERMLEIGQFDKMTRNSQGELKPILVCFVDGGPDENPRYPKTIQVAIHHFVKNDYDARFIATNAPGRSAFNPVERRMAPLSKVLSGLILSHEHFGSHLDKSKKTIDSELEERNFFHAQEVLSERFESIKIDGHNVVSEAIAPNASEMAQDEIMFKDQQWTSHHVRSSQYLLQIKKCNDLKCCSIFRSQINSYFRGFLPPPVAMVTDEVSRPQLAVPRCSPNPKFMSLMQTKALFNSEEIPYDYFCPSVTQKALADRTCKSCNIYFGSVSLLNKHTVVHKASRQVKGRKVKKLIDSRPGEFLVENLSDSFNGEVEWLEEDEIDFSDVHPIETSDQDDCFPLRTLETFLELPWEEIIDEH